MTTNETEPSETFSRPARSPLTEGALHLPMGAEGRDDYLAQRIRYSTRWMWAAVVIGMVGPIIPVALFWNEAALFEQLFGYHYLAGLGGIGGVLVGIAAPLWALVRGGIERDMLRRYRDEQADQATFLARHNRCPVDFRNKRMGR